MGVRIKSVAAEIFTLFFTWLVKFALSDTVVNTDSGPIQGVPSLSEGVEAFLGIPYAEPPVGELRFAKPVPKTKWRDVYNATNLPPPCVQYLIYPYYFLPDVTNMSEDCLYLNMWVPKSEPVRVLRPIIIFFHYGSFVAGSSNIKVLDGSRFASRGDVIVVTLNFRLGALGFLATDTEDAAGNMAMYDQIMAMRWTKQNAKHFGGNPENIVLMGVSSGACAVSAHLVSPLSKNLFQKAIVQSGTLLSPLFADNTQLYDYSQSVASIVGCTNQTVSLKSDPKTVVKCMKNKPKEDFAAAEKILLKTHPLIFYPRINDPFLPKNMSDLLRGGYLKRDVDLLIGTNAEEGSMFLIVGLRDYFDFYGRNNLNMNKHRAAAFSRAAGLLVRLYNSPEMTKFYLGGVRNRTPTGYTKMVADILGDYAIGCSTVFFADFLSLKGNAVYFYTFGFRSPSTPLAEWTGATHLDELPYIFGNPFHDNFTSEEIELSHRLMDRWSTFAKTGNPNIAGHMPWLPYSYETPLYMNFGQEEESIRLRPNNRCEFWRKQFDSVFDPKSIEFSSSPGMNTWEAYSFKTFISISIVIHILSFM